MFYIDKLECIQMNQIILQTNTISHEELLRIRFLSELSKLISFSSASFLLAKPKTIFIRDDIVCYNLKDTDRELFLKQFAAKDEVLPYLCSPAPFSYRLTDLISINHSDIYDSFFRPQGLHFSQGMNLVWENHFLGAVVLYRNRPKENFNEKDLFLLSQFQDHLSQRLHSAIFPSYLQEARLAAFMENYNFTLREMELIDLILQGYTNQQISEALFIHIYTVKTHLKNIFRKLNICHRAQIHTMFQSCI